MKLEKHEGLLHCRNFINLGKSDSFFKKDMILDFSGGPVVKNPLANAGHMSLILLGRFHVLWDNSVFASQLLKPSCSRAHVPQVLNM